MLKKVILRTYFFIITLLFAVLTAHGQVTVDSTITLASDTLIPTPKKEPVLKSEVKYSASDSIIFSLSGDKVFLYKNARVSYEDVELTAFFIELDLAKNEAYACGTRDSLGNDTENPVYTDKSGEYTMRSMRYNFESRKAKIEHVVTEQGEGHVVGYEAKKMENDEICLKGGVYTTCDNHDHPHFGLVMTKAKVIPGKKTITGPAYLMFEDVPFPLVLPFAYVPSTSKYSSGIIMPSYGEESSRGFFLQNGGYYFAASDYFDLKLTGDIYTNGSWGLHTGSQYKKRYKYNGNINFQYLTNISGEKGFPDYSKNRDFSFNMTHTQDPKANRYNSISASINFSTSSFDQNNITNTVDPYKLATNTKRSSVSYSKRWPTGPFNLSANLLHSQNSKDTTIDLTLPDVTLTMNRIFPFKNKDRLGSNEIWYEKINFSYSANMKNYISTKEYELMSSNLTEDWKNGIKHTLPVSMNLKFLKHFTASPSISYTERWYTSAIKQGYDSQKQQIVNTDTIQGFNRVFDYNYGISTSTKIYTFFKPWRSLFGNKVEAIRHVITPSIGFSARPDFSQSRFGYYDKFEYYDAKKDSIIKYEYSLYKDGIYGSPDRGKSASIGFGFDNTLEMKVKSDKDTTGFKKIALIENFNFGSSYNMLADSLNFSSVNFSGRTKLFKTDLNFGAVFDPYQIELSPSGTPIRVDKAFYDIGNIPLRLESANLSFGMSFNNESFKKKKKEGVKNSESSSTDLENEDSPDTDKPEESKSKNLDYDEDGYSKFKLPWSFNFNYNSRIVQDEYNPSRKDFDKKLTADINFGGSISPTPKWNLSLSSGYSLETKKMAHTTLNIQRDLHCWSMSFNLVPTGKYKSYFFTISANSSMLKDLKYEKRNSYRDNGNF